MSGRYIKQNPYVDDYGIYVPDKEYIPEGCVGLHRCIITKEMFVEAYNKWIKNDSDKYDHLNYDEDDADCWCE